MANIVSYARENLKGFSEQPFSDVDSLLFSALIYLHLEAVPTLQPGGECSLRDLWQAEYFTGMLNGVGRRDEKLELLATMCASPRYRNMRVHGYETVLEKEDGIQFAACTFVCPGDFLYVAYRGTDSSFVGWKEDCRLALTESIPAQKRARAYLERVAGELSGVIYVGGHSKGGNLASYAAAMCDEAVQDRIVCAYSHDGPGFKPEELVREGFIRMRPRMRKTLPQSSVVGLLFQPEGNCAIIESTGSGLEQHSPFTWAVEGQDFHYRAGLSKAAEVVYRRVNGWLADMNEQEMNEFIEALFEVLENTGVDTLTDLHTDGRKMLPTMWKSLRKTDKEQTKVVLHALALLLVPDSITDGASERIGHMVEAIHSHAGDVADFAVDKAGIVKDKAVDVAAVAKDKAGDVADKAKVIAGGVLTKAREVAGEIASTVKEKAMEAVEAIEETEEKEQ